MNNTILIMGGDGYYGWPLAMRIAVKYPTQKIIIIDNEWRRNIVKNNGFKTLIPVKKTSQRIVAFNKLYKQNNLYYIKADINSDRIQAIIKEERPHTIFHLAQQCSAPYSMKGAEEALFTIHNNEAGNMRLLWAVRKYVPNAHIIKLGSFGEYAKGGIDIAEGYFFPRHNDVDATKPMPYPREADDIYHISKINDTNYAAMACRVWNLRITDVMQSTIFGFLTEEMDNNEDLYTRCDYDHIFGTVVNRFITQTVTAHPLTVYGTGNQRTGLMALRDSVNSLVNFIEDAPLAGVHRVVNHVTETNFSINELADTIKNLAEAEGYHVDIKRTHDPRQEQKDAKLEYGIDTRYQGHDTLHTSFAEVTREMLTIANRFKGNIIPAQFTPSVYWNEDINKEVQAHTFIDNTDIDNDLYWKEFREQHFRNKKINLNPGTLGTTSNSVKKSRNQRYGIADAEGFPLASYETARKSLEDINSLCEELWPAPNHRLTVTNSTSQTMNLLALAMLRKLHGIKKGKYKVVTTTHEHEGGIGCFQHLPEYEIYYIDDRVLADKQALHHLLKELQPDVAFFSHVFYDTGNIAPVAEWVEIVKSVLPDCKTIIDVAQSLGLFDLPFDNADVVLGSTHKWLFGPHGGGLMWMHKDFHEWIEAIYWSSHGLTHTTHNQSISIPGGQDFRLYPAITESLRLFKETGKSNVLARSKYLGRIFGQKLDELFTLAGHKHIFLNNTKASPIISIAFNEYDPYPLYKYLNEHQIHTKCIKNHLEAGINYHILRLGIPYYESVERLNYALNEIANYLQVIYSI